MTGNKKVLCKTCYKEMRSDNLARHMKQHFKKNENNPVTNIDSMIKRIMDLQKECTELSNKYPSNWISDLQERNQNLIEKYLNMRKESRQKEKETQNHHHFDDFSSLGNSSNSHFTVDSRVETKTC